MASKTSNKFKETMYFLWKYNLEVWGMNEFKYILEVLFMLFLFISMSMWAEFWEKQMTSKEKKCWKYVVRTINLLLFSLEPDIHIFCGDYHPLRKWHTATACSDQRGGGTLGRVGVVNDKNQVWVYLGNRNQCLISVSVFQSIFFSSETETFLLMSSKMM